MLGPMSELQYVLNKIKKKRKKSICLREADVFLAAISRGISVNESINQSVISAEL